MALSLRKLTISRMIKPTLIAVALVVASGGMLQRQLLDELWICAASVKTASAAGGSAALAATNPPTKEGAMTSDMHAPTIFTLRTGVAEGRMVFLGVGGDINGAVNPSIVVHEGETVQINLINGEGAEHDIVIDQYGARSNRVIGKGASSAVTFTASKTGEFAYYCSAAGHREAGMEGRIQVLPGPRAAVVATAADIVHDPIDLPPPIGARPPQIVRVDLRTVEVQGQLADKTTYNYWTFNGKVPGPMVRVRVGDTVEAHLKNDANSVMTHSVDFHAALGPGGGAEFTQTDPGDEKIVSFKALTPGLFVYHCATPSVPQHITNGMYGMILVEPEGGLPQVDREFYVMQGELYTAQPFGAQGDQEMDYDKLISGTARIFSIQRRCRGADKVASIARQRRRDDPHLLRRRRPELHLVVSFDRRGVRPCLSIRRPDLAADHGHSDRNGAARRLDNRRYEGSARRPLHARRSRLGASRARPRGLPHRRRPAGGLAHACGAGADNEGMRIRIVRCSSYSPLRRCMSTLTLHDGSVLSCRSDRARSMLRSPLFTGSAVLDSSR